MLLFTLYELFTHFNFFHNLFLIKKTVSVAYVRGGDGFHSQQYKINKKKLTFEVQHQQREDQRDTGG